MAKENLNDNDFECLNIKNLQNSHFRVNKRTKPQVYKKGRMCAGLPLFQYLPVFVNLNFKGLFLPYDQKLYLRLNEGFLLR